MFEWDPNKREANIAKHGLDLASGAAMFDGRAAYTYPSPRGEEQRFVTVGLLSGIMVAVVWLQRADAKELEMRSKKNFVRVTAEQAAQIAAAENRTDWPCVKAMRQAEVERLANEEDGPLPADWTNTIVFGAAEPKQDVHIRLDAAVVRWFKAQGPGYQTRINEVLAGFVASRGKV